MGKPAAHPEGHFYSPVVDTDEIKRDEERIWPGSLEVPGIDMREAAQRDLLERHFPGLLREYNYPLEGPPDEELSFYYERNSQFGWLDSRALFCLMRLIRPSRIVEVGSGYSSLLMRDINDRFLKGNARLTFIEPYPRAFLVQGAEAGRYELIRKRVQEVDQAIFDSLESGDILFIDSSHVSKTGSDVNHLFLNVLPRLAPGVYVHVHDVFLPEDYRKEWAIDENRSWNEQYLLQALLVENPNFEVVFGSLFAFRRFPELVSAAIGQPAFGGGSFWIRRKPQRLKEAWRRLRRRIGGE
jgi:predicted O-methyltransferase YrrM